MCRYSENTLFDVQQLLTVIEKYHTSQKFAFISLDNGKYRFPENQQSLIAESKQNNEFFTFKLVTN